MRKNISLVVGLSIGALVTLPSSLWAFSQQIGPRVAMELGADNLEILLAPDSGAEVLDVEVSITPHRGNVSVAVLDPSRVVLAGAQLARPEGSFRVDMHALLAVDNDDGSESLGEVVHRAYFLCSEAGCGRTSFSNYMTLEFDDEGKMIMVLSMTEIGGAQ
jgi:hypothetical protein